MRAVGQAVRPEDCLLVGLDWDWLIVVDLLHKNAIKKNPGGPDTSLAATDPAHRGPREGERGARARRSAGGRGPFAPASIHITVNPISAVANGGILFLEAPSRRRDVEGIHHDVSTGRCSVFLAGRLDR